MALAACLCSPALRLEALGAVGLPRSSALRSAPSLEKIAVFESDRRVPLPDRLKPLGNVIGLLFNNRARSVCTAFCVGADLVATAAHCLYRSEDQPQVQLSDFWFIRRWAGDTRPTGVLGRESRGADQNVIAGSVNLSVRPPIDAAHDWAIVRLATPACRNGGLKVQAMGVQELMAASSRGLVYNVAFHRDIANWRLAYSRPCRVARDFPGGDWATISRDFVEPEHIILHQCDTAEAELSRVFRRLFRVSQAAMAAGSSRLAS